MNEQPKYMRIAEDLRTRIKDGILKPGDRVPRRQVIMADYGCMDQCVTKAMTRVAAEGLIHHIPVYGYFVSGIGGSDPRVYVRIMDDIRGEIADGKLQPGDRMPSVAALCDRYRCGRKAATKALMRLENENAVHRVKGLGYFVT